MHKKNKISFRVQGIALPTGIAAELRGKQSVRATFKLSEQTINTVSVVASHLGIKQKSLFDHLMHDFEVLKSIATEIEEIEFKPVNQVQKTYVVSRKSLDYLETASKRYHTPRDLLVEFSVQRLLPIIEKERLQNIKRKKVYAKLQAYLQNGTKILKETIDDLGDDDVTVEMLYSVLSPAEMAVEELESLIRKGDLIEELLGKKSRPTF